jgi:C4-type Zn-finger protein
MAKYNTFVVQKTNNGRTVLVTSSARKARQMLTVGHRVEVWKHEGEVISDYVDVVRCGKCKYQHTCSILWESKEPKEFGFCSLGERCLNV